MSKISRFSYFQEKKSHRTSKRCFFESPGDLFFGPAIFRQIEKRCVGENVALVFHLFHSFLK